MASGAMPNAAVERAKELVCAADGIVAITPVFAASYSGVGVFKMFVDALGTDALNGMPMIVAATAGVLNADGAGWTPGRRVEDGSRAVAAYVARRRCGYAVTAMGAALGYASHGGVVAAIAMFVCVLRRRRKHAA